MKLLRAPFASVCAFTQPRLANRLKRVQRHREEMVIRNLYEINCLVSEPFLLNFKTRDGVNETDVDVGFRNF